MMARDALQVLVRLRDAAVRDATATLARALGSLREAEARLQAQQARIVAERQGSAGHAPGDFANWLPHARQQAEALADAAAQENARVARCQAALVACRMEAETVAKAIERRAQAAAVVTQRREQAVMDEAAGRARRR